MKEANRSRRVAARVLGRPGRYAIACGLTAAAVAAPIALGATSTTTSRNAVVGGTRNPTSSSTQRPAFSRETEVIANNGTYGTRQSNLSNNGGGAIYGCRSATGGTPAGQEPCVRANNLSTGEAFEYQFTFGTLGGIIQSGTSFAHPNPGAKPFITNATGVATGLNADRVDDMNAGDIVAKAASSREFALVRGTPSGADTVVDASSQNVADANVTHPGTGVYCIAGLSPAPKTATANLQTPPSSATDVATVYLDTSGTSAACPGTEQVAVQVRDGSGAPADGSFSLQIDG